MKIQHITILFLLSLLWACNPLEETYKKLDETKEDYHKEITYTLLAEDYTTVSDAALKAATNETDEALAKDVNSDDAFNQFATPVDFMAPVLSKQFPALGIGSVAKVTFNTIIKPENITKIEASQDYELSDDDYQTAGGKVAEMGFFFPSAPASAYMPKILTTALPESKIGDLVVASYLYSPIDPSSGTKPIEHFNYDFQTYADKDTIGDGDGWSQFIETGNRGWKARVFSENGYAQYSSFGSKEENIAYLITPLIDASGTEFHELTFDINVGYWTHDGLQVLITDEYDGTNFEGASWEDITANFTLPQTPTNGYGTFINAGVVDISKYTTNISIAFKYSGDANNTKTTTYQIDNVKVREITEGSVLAEPYLVNELYEYTGSWGPKANTYVLKPIDYEAMGKPGNSHSFSSSISPANYLPKFLAIKYPFSQVNDAITLAYNYLVDTVTSKKAGEYIFNGSVWETLSTGIIYVDNAQYLYNKQGWVYDPTIKLSPSSKDLQLLVDYVYTNLSRTYGSTYGNDEFYYGASAYYVNFDLRLSTRAKYSIPGFEDVSEADGIALTWQRVEEGLNIMLGLKYTEAVPEISGIQVDYLVTFNTFQNDLSKKAYTGVFNFVEGQGFVRNIDREDELVKEGSLTADVVNWNR